MILLSTGVFVCVCVCVCVCVRACNKWWTNDALRETHHTHIAKRYADDKLQCLHQYTHIHTHTHTYRHTHTHTMYPAPCSACSCFKHAVFVFIWWQVINVTDRQLNWVEVGAWEKILRTGPEALTPMFPSLFFLGASCQCYIFISTQHSNCSRIYLFFFLSFP